jgi:hypothetical protein
MLVIDLSREAVESGALAATVQGLTGWLSRFEEELPMRVGLITYSDRVTVYELGRDIPERIVLMDDAVVSWAFHDIMTSSRSQV